MNDEINIYLKKKNSNHPSSGRLSFLTSKTAVLLSIIGYAAATKFFNESVPIISDDNDDNKNKKTINQSNI
jgi:hypothetical protein